MIMFTQEQLKHYFDRLNHWSIYFTFDRSGKVYFSRGLETVEDITEYIFDGNSVTEIMSLLSQ